MLHFGRSVLLAVALVVTSVPALADTVAMLELTGTDVPEEALKRFEESLHEGLEGAGYEVKSRSKIAAALKKSEFVSGCTFGPCMRVLRQVTGVDRAVVVHVQGLGSSYTFVASLVETKRGRLEVQVSETCAACSIDDAAATASMVGSSLLLKEGGVSGEDGSSNLTSSSGSAGRDRSAGSGLRVASYVFMGASVVAGAAGAYFLADDDRDRGLPLVVGAGTGLVSGFTMFLFSRRF